MSQRTTGILSIEAASRIIGIQFSLLSPEEIRRASVAEITSRDTYINGKPVIGGLFDPRMGTLEPGLLCPTDGLDHIQTPGYFGHLELSRPVFYIQYLATVLKILRCVCFKCSKLLLNKESHAAVLDMPAHERWLHVFPAASKIGRCGEDSHDGCGCKQPKKLKKEGFATIIAEWKDVEGGVDAGEDKEDLSLHLTPELCLKILRRISDDDITFMGFSPVWSRPEWMICQVLAVPPPAVRPSVKHDAHQRSEDDLSHILVNIIKTNITLQEKIQNEALPTIINDWTLLLQYYTATLVDNKIPGVAAFAQRSGRPLKSVKERLNGKHGRVRGNLMGKRVDYSARSVITPDPNLSIAELGVPKKIAMNLTYPECVNTLNMNAMLRLVQNGPLIYPGAKILERKSGERIFLENVDRASLTISYGDKVHRHMLDGDPVLFNRQPTLHRMSMMCHLARVMEEGDTFRMNVADTKPYNADFDGDEMNMHMPQDEESKAELKLLAAVPWHIISPANNKSIVGIFQDSLLGSYLMTKANTTVTMRRAMSLLMQFDKVDIIKLGVGETVSTYSLMSQILPPMSISRRTNQYSSGEEGAEINGTVDIANGTYLSGQLDKAVLGDGSKGLIHRICNDFGNMAAADFIDNIQNIVTEFMNVTAYSVGISDLMANDKTNDEITNVITEKKRDVQSLIDQTHLGIFENKSGQSNDIEFESRVNDVLGQALSQAGRIGLKSLSSNNRFVTMVKAGSKGSDINISQMVSCLGQQQVDGKRIPYGFEERTLPHYTKFDDSPVARGFVEQSFIDGLKPAELFFHAMGGRVGLIDTAVKTSQTGYIQRRLIKALEDLKVEYDMTVRNGKNKVIQFRYGDDSFDTIKVEKQTIPIAGMTPDEVYSQIDIPLATAIAAAIYTPAAAARAKEQSSKLEERTKNIIDYMLKTRHDLVDNVFSGRNETAVHCPVALKHMVANVAGQIGIGPDNACDITGFEVIQLLDGVYGRLKKVTFAPPTPLFKLLLYYHCSPAALLGKYRLNKVAVELLFSTIEEQYYAALVAPGEMVGIIAAQSIGEPTTQMTLNTFHFAGVASKSNVTRGVPRIEEILSLSENPKNPSCTVYLPSTGSPARQADVQRIMPTLEYTPLRSVVETVEIHFEPESIARTSGKDALLEQQFQAFERDFASCLGTEIDDKPRSSWVIRLEISNQELLERGLTMDDVAYAIKQSYADEIDCVFSDYNAKKLVMRIRLMKAVRKNSRSNKGKMHPLDQQDEIHLLQTFQNQLLDDLVLRGVAGISKVLPRKVLDGVRYRGGKYIADEEWVLDTVGTNLVGLLGLDSVDARRTTTNDIQEVCKLLGIEAARQSIFNELTEVIEFDNTYINYHHLSMLCDRMTCNQKMVSVFRHGINNDDIGPIAKASFEETPEMFMKAARHGELDPMRGLSANVLCGQRGNYGTNAFEVLLDTSALTNLGVATQPELGQDEHMIEQAFVGLGDPDSECSRERLGLNQNAENVVQRETGSVPDDYSLDF